MTQPPCFPNDGLGRLLYSGKNNSFNFKNTGKTLYFIFAYTGVEFTLEEAMNAQRGSRGIPLPFL